MSKRGMTAKIPLMAVAAIGGVVVGYSLLSPSTPEIRRAIPVKDEVNKAIPVDSETDFDEVNLPPDTEIRRAKPVHLPVASRQPQQRLPSDEEVGILPNRRQPDTPKREDTEREVKKAIAGPQPKDGSSELKPVEQYQANVESADDDDDDDDE